MAVSYDMQKGKVSTCCVHGAFLISFFFSRTRGLFIAHIKQTNKDKRVNLNSSGPQREAQFEL